MPLLIRIFPRRFDNRYHGLAPGVWLLALITVQKLGECLTHLFKADGGAQSLSRMPLDSYPASAVTSIVGLMARTGLEQLLLVALLVLVLVRYRAMIPLMYAVLVAHELGSRGVSVLKPLALAGTSGVTVVHLVIGILSTAGLLLSLMGKGYRDPA